MLVNVGPILIALLAGAVLGEGLPRWLLVGAGVAFSGALLIGPPLRGRRRRTASGWCSACWRRSPGRSGVMAQKPLLRRLPRCR
jgi:hypothetical protein